MLAAKKKHEKVVIELVRVGANVNEKNKVRQPLAYFHHRVDVVVIALMFVVIVWEDRSHVGC